MANIKHFSLLTPDFSLNISLEIASGMSHVVRIQLLTEDKDVKLIKRRN